LAEAYLRAIFILKDGFERHLSVQFLIDTDFLKRGGHPGLRVQTG
jgi:hypothetical protein